MAGNIFVSYRRDDSKHAAGRLVDRLQTEFDPDQLFLDVDNIELGLDFVEVINERVAACEVMLVIIGPQWLNATNKEGARRLHDPRDFVRLEVEVALERNIRVIPILVDGAAPVKEQDLPDSLAPLANRQATRLAHETFTADAERLTRALVRILDTTATQADEPEGQKTGSGDVRLDPGGTATKAASRNGKPGIEYTATFRRSEISQPESAQQDEGTLSTRQFATDAPEMVETRTPIYRRLDDPFGWFVALSPAILGLILGIVIGLFGLTPSDFKWFDDMPGENTAFALPLIGSICLVGMRIEMGKPVSPPILIAGGVCFTANLLLVIFTR